MPVITVTSLLFDDTNEAKFWAHGIVVEQLIQLLGNGPVITKNRRGHAAPYLLIGRDDSGRCIAVPVLSTHVRYVWRPITAWYCKPSEAAKLR